VLLTKLRRESVSFLLTGSVSQVWGREALSSRRNHTNHSLVVSPTTVMIPPMPTKIIPMANTAE